MDVKTYTYDTISISKMAIHLAKQDQIFVDEARTFIEKSNNEDSYIQISNLIISYYSSLYDTASSDKEKQSVIENMCDLFKKIFGDRYLKQFCWKTIFMIRKSSGMIKKYWNDVVDLIDEIDYDKHPITASYIYRKIANYIVNGDLFYTEPYMSMLDRLVQTIENVEFDISKQPDYLT